MYNDDEYEEDRDFENKYDKLFGAETENEEDYEHDVITGRKHKRPKMSVLNKGKLSKQEMDDLFLEY
jgi:hypothetical protein